MTEKSADLFQTYQLFIIIHQDISIQVGRLGECFFPAGCYVYTGSAKRGMNARLARHFSKGKKYHWHIDYLLGDSQAEIIQTKKFAEPECFINSKTSGLILIPGFGSSDCRAGCKSHLKYQTPLHHS